MPACAVVRDRQQLCQPIFVLRGCAPPHVGGLRIVGQYVATQLQAPLTLKAPSELGLETARQFGRTLSTRADVGSPRDGDVAEGLKFFVVGDTFSRNSKADFASDQFDIDGVGGTAGVAYGFDNGTVGIAGNYSRPRAKFVGDVSRTEANSWQIGGFAGFALAGAFAQGYAGYGWDNLDIERQGVVEGMTASPTPAIGSPAPRPAICSRRNHARRPGGRARLCQGKGRRLHRKRRPGAEPQRQLVSAKSLTGGIGAELRGDFDTSGMSVRPYLSAMLEKELLDGDRTVYFAQTSAPGIVNSWTFDRTKKAYGRISGGGSAAILERGYAEHGPVDDGGRDDGNDVSAQVGLNVGF